MNRLQTGLNALARRYGRKKKRLYALKPAVGRKAVSGRLGTSDQAAKIDPDA